MNCLLCCPEPLYIVYCLWPIVSECLLQGLLKPATPDVADALVQIMNEAILITIVISMPTIVVSLVIGLAVAIFSATTQIQEQTLSFVPKMIAVFAVLGATAAWTGSTMLRFAQHCFQGFVDVVR